MLSRIIAYCNQIVLLNSGPIIPKQYTKYFDLLNHTVIFFTFTLRWPKVILISSGHCSCIFVVEKNGWPFLLSIRVLVKKNGKKSSVNVGRSREEAKVEVNEQCFRWLQRTEKKSRLFFLSKKFGNSFVSLPLKMVRKSNFTKI